jgi:hypothetical protein
MFAGTGSNPYMQLAVNILLSNGWIGKLNPSAKRKSISVYLERADLISQTPVIIRFFFLDVAYMEALIIMRYH